jgi:hypothetical protein
VILFSWKLNFLDRQEKEQDALAVLANLLTIYSRLDQKLFLNKKNFEQFLYII